MRFPRLLLLFTLLFLSPAGFSLAGEKAFYDQNISYSATTYENYLKSNWSAAGRSISNWKRLGETSLNGGDAETASRAFASAVVLDTSDAPSWLGLAKAYLIMPTKKPGDEYRFRDTATSAAYLAYTRAKTGAMEADALTVLGEVLAKRQYWRPALNAYKAALGLREDTELRATYEKLKAEHGFRMIDYKVESDAEEPRVCAQFSEQLTKTRIDFAKFVSVNGKDPASVRRDDYQLCVGGFTHGERYEITIRKGLPSTVGENISKTINLTVYVRDRSPSVRFSGRNYVLAKTGQNGIPLVTVNTDNVKLKLYRIGDRALLNSILNGNFTRQISNYTANDIANKKGEEIWSGEMSTKLSLNKEVTTAFPIDDALPTRKAGLYALIAQPTTGKQDDWSKKATQWFVISDLGLTAFSGKDGIHTFVRSLASAEAIKDVKVRLIARNNEVLSTAKTDSNGHIHFTSGITRGEGGNEPAVLIAERPGTDYVFLDLTKSSFDLTDRGVGGRRTPPPLDAFIYAERGVYRPGEQIHITALLRDEESKAVPNLPLTLIYERPDGVEYQRTTVKDEGFGGRSHSLTLQTTAMTGTWYAKLYADPKEPSIGETSFLVEDYVPERLELTLAADDTPLASGDKSKVSLEGRYLYGAPASDLSLDGEITVSKNVAGFEGYEGYKFGVPAESFTPIRRPLFKLPRTDKDGKASLEAEIPRLPETTQALKAVVTVRLEEPGGRNVSEKINLKIKPSKPVVGIKPLFKRNHVEENRTASFNIVALGTELTPVPMKGLKWELLEINRHFQWYNQEGSWRYQPITYTKRVAKGDFDLDAQSPFQIDSTTGNGRFRLEITSEDENAGPIAEYEFSAGNFASEDADTPDILDIAFDKEEYKPGDTAKITLSPRMSGKAVISVMSDKLLETKTLDVEKGDNVATLTVSEDWFPGAYVTATLFRPMDVPARRMPSRAIGIKWLSLEQNNQTLTVNLDLPEKSRPGQKLSVPVKLSGLAEGKTARIVLAAVDVGILNLTDYKAPTPSNWYYGQRRLGTEIRDLYGHLIDGMAAVRGKVRSGGDGGGLNIDASPPSQKPVALYSGIVAVSEDGTAKVNFDIPAFDGTLRIMGIAWNDTQLGQIEQDIIIRDPVVLTSTTPRFLTSGDKSFLHLTINNVEGASGDYTVDVGLEGPLSTEAEESSKALSLKTGERKSVSVPLTAKDIGDAKITVSLLGPDEYEATRAYDLKVFPAAPDVKRHLVSKLSKQGGQLIISEDAFSGLIPQTVQVSVNVGPGAALDVPGLLLALDRYPHGCAEQITSRAMPLLYLSSLAEKSKLAGDNGAKQRVQAAIDRLAELQDSSGTFGLWSAGSGNIWLTAYITDFMTRAKDAGYTVKEKTFNQALDRLANFLNYAPDFSSGGEDVAYALYVLSRNSRANIGDMRYFADTKLGDFSSPLAKAQLGASLSLYGDKPRSTTVFQSAISDLMLKADTAEYRSDFGSNLRDSAAALTLVSETGVERAKIPTLTQVLERMRTAKTYTSTQENAWLLLAANALLDDNKPLTLDVNGTKVTKAVQKTLTVEDFAAGKYIVTNKGEDPLSASVTVYGASMTPEPPAEKGFILKREYFTLEGKPADLKNISQNDRFVAVLTLTEQQSRRGRLILVDRLPAGFEIENPSLVNGTSISSLSWLGSTLSPTHTSFRDDKFVAAFHFGSSSAKAKPATAKFAYIVRAVAPGTYVHPAANVEDMYRPDRFAQTAGGEITIKAASR